MKLKTILASAFLVCSAQLVLAQTAPPADPVSGVWKGYATPDGGQNKLPLVVTLKLAGPTSLTGTVTGPPQPGDIKTGSYDQATGMLKFDVSVDGTPNPYVFQGTVAVDTVTGRVTNDGFSAVFNLSKGSADAAAARPDSGIPSAELTKSFGEVATYVTKAANLVPPDKYTYRPSQNVRTFAQQIAHIVDSNNYFCAVAAGRNVQWSDAVEKGSLDKATLVEKLKQSIDACTPVYSGSTGKRAPMIDNIGHVNLHYGNIITYLRMLGLVPPSS